MDVRSATPPLTGFFTVLRTPDQALVGGLLLLNPQSRPLEFHCTAPVKPNRAQEILYGPTLLPFLHGEQIGKALLAKCSQKPQLVFTDSEPGLWLREVSDCAVVCVPAPEQPSGLLHSFRIGEVSAAISTRHGDDESQVMNAFAPFAALVNPLEPFARIREAIEEAQKVTAPKAA
jgi:hypothetical protein